MKKITFLVTIVFMGMNVMSNAQNLIVDKEKSNIEWNAKKVGGEHSGNIKLKSGTLKLRDNRIIQGNFIVDMTSITNTDIENETYNNKLIGHLKSDDFFSVSKYPTASFIVNKSSKFVNGKATLTGKLTIKDNTEVIKFDVMKSDNSYSAKISINRSKFNVRYGSNSFFDNLGDKAIEDIFTCNS